MAMRKLPFRTKRVRSRGRKRFGAKWSIGGSYSHPLFGKIGGSFKSNSLSSKVKAIVRKGIETPQHATISDQNAAITGPAAFPSGAMRQNVVYALTFMDQVPQGVANNNRVGDTVHIDAIKYNFTVNGLYGSSVYDKTFRLLLIKKDIQTNTAGLFNSSVFTLADLAMRDSITGSYSGATYSPNAILDPKKVTVLHDETISLHAPYDGSINEIVQKTISGTIRLDQKYVYQTSQTYGKDYNLYWVVMSSIPVGAYATPVTGSCFLNTDLIFKNCV